MHGFMYIAGSFETVDRQKCGRGKGWVDNDPHFWTNPPTWGICRNDIRRRVKEGSYIFFVLPMKAKHPQMIFGYLNICKILTHQDAFSCADLKSKRMGKKNPNGNIIVDERGRYNRYDGGMHKHIFGKVKQQYAIGDSVASRFLTRSEILGFAPNFVGALRRILEKEGTRPIDLISRYGCELSAGQVQEFLRWLNPPLPASFRAPQRLT